MPLNVSSPTILHLIQNASLIALSLLLAPFITIFTILSCIISPHTLVSKHISHHRKWRASSSATFRSRTVLVTGVGMAKGLVIARCFYRDGHRVIGADFEPNNISVNGRFSVALTKFYRLNKPLPETGGSEKYVESLLNIITKEKVELWVSCSGVASAIEDAEAAEAIESFSTCKAIQFNVSTTRNLHDKYSFFENTARLGLHVPETHLVMSEEDAAALLHQSSIPSHGCRAKQFILKPIGIDDSVRSDMTLLPLKSDDATAKYVHRMAPSSSRPFVLQQFISGPEYCTHALIIEGHVKIFTVCPSAELLMQYRALPSSSPLFQAMLRYTQLYAGRMGTNMSGHFSIDFLLNEPEQTNVKKTVEEIMQAIYPIECNPRAHTAVVLFADRSEDMADAYLSILSDHEPRGIATGHRREEIVIPSSTVSVYYWLGHDMVTRVIMPFLALLTLKKGLTAVLSSFFEFLEHLLFWRDGTYEIWDPWPFWWLYIVYWPGTFAASIVKRSWWSRCNVSTTKIFEV